MSSVHAATEDITFVVKIASFRAPKTDMLVKEFSDWIAQKGKEQDFLVWSVSLEGKMREKPNGM